MVVFPHAANSGSQQSFDLVMFSLLRSSILWNSEAEARPPVANRKAGRIAEAGLLQRSITRQQIGEPKFGKTI